MTTSNFLALLLVLFCSTLKAQSSCTNNLIPNGDLSQGTPSNSDNDIDNAVGFSSIWTGGSSADFYLPNYSPVATLPQPVTGNYVSFWVANNNAPTSSSFNREGFKFELAQPIAPNSGTYTFTFDMACLHGWGNAELGVYGIYNPTNASSATPTAFHVPTNMQLFGAANTIAFSPIAAPLCNNNKTSQTVTINTSAIGFPTNGITHIFFTHSGNQTGGAHYSSFDNFCLKSISHPCPSIFDKPTIFCIPDQDRDGLPEYMVRFSTINPGSIEIYSSCLTNSPLTFTSPGINSLIINSSQNCNNATLQYTMRDYNNNICNLGQLTFKLGKCDGVFPLRPNVVQPITAHPNPASRQLVVMWEKENTTALQIQILDMQGRVWKQYTNVDSWAGQFTIPVQDLKAGLYLVQISGEGYAPTPVKFLKQ